jgi:thiol-disulfide isomerase/thioredoxin
MKKYPVLITLLASFLLFPAFAGAADAAADKAFADIQALGFKAGGPPPPPQGATQAERTRTSEMRRQALRSQGMAFYQAYPTDPRRWDVVALLLGNPPAFMTFGPSFDTNFEDRTSDEPAAQAWKVQLFKLDDALAAATDVPEDLKPALPALQTSMDRLFLEQALYQHLPVDWSRMHSRMVAQLTREPRAMATTSMLRMYMYSYDGAHTPAESMAEWKTLAAIPGVAESDVGKSEADFYAEVSKPVEIAFKATDGRQVDLKELRGKVVYVDFWGTWCHDCKNEMPNLVAMYKKYHDKGFEVLGITMEHPVRPADTGEAAAAKVEASRRKLLDFARDHDMPWPESYDENGIPSPLVARYHVGIVPEAFLIDREGRIAAINPFGPDLEKNLRRQLGL